MCHLQMMKQLRRLCGGRKCLVSPRESDSVVERESSRNFGAVKELPIKSSLHHAAVNLLPLVCVALIWSSLGSAVLITSVEFGRMMGCVPERHLRQAAGSRSVIEGVSHQLIFLCRNSEPDGIISIIAKIIKLNRSNVQRR